MRGVLLSLAFAFVVATAVPSTASASQVRTTPALSTSPAYALQVPDKKIDITIGERSGGGTGAWYRNPVWIAIAIVAAVLILLLLVLVARGGGGGTTIVKD